MPSADPTSPDRLHRLYREADALLIAVGRGFSRLNGFDLFADTPWFRRTFRDLRERHRIRTIAEGIGFRWPAPVMEWAFMGRLVHHVCLSHPASEHTGALARMADLRPTFLLTTNIENRFSAAGLGDERLFEMAGNLRQMACQRGCSGELLPADGFVRAMLRPGPKPVIAPEHLPRCPRCGGPLVTAIAAKSPFALSEQRKLQEYRLALFARTHCRSRLLILELGVSPWNTSMKAIATALAQHAPHSTYVVVGRETGYLPPELYDRTLLLTDGIPRALAALTGGR